MSFSFFKRTLIMLQKCKLPKLRGVTSAIYQKFHSGDTHFCAKTEPTHKKTYRSKKMATNTENKVKKNKDSTQKMGKNIHEHLNTGKRSDDTHRLSEQDLRQYEQLVIMKKYPYLDIKELELKYSPTADKNVRQSVNFASDSDILGDLGLRESVDEGPCVEINNRGLSGFAIPVKLSKGANTEQHTSNVNIKIPQVKEFKTLIEELSNNS